MEKIWSAVVYKNDKEDRRVMYVKAPCTSYKAALEYSRILSKWWKGYLVTVDGDFPTTIATAKALHRLPF